MVFCVGESLTLPLAVEVVVTVLVLLPVVAVIVSEVAFVIDQFSVTLWPAVMVLALAEKVSVGDAGGGVPPPPPEPPDPPDPPELPLPLPLLPEPLHAMRAKRKKRVAKVTRTRWAVFISYP